MTHDEMKTLTRKFQGFHPGGDLDRLVMSVDKLIEEFEYWEKLAKFRKGVVDDTKSKNKEDKYPAWEERYAAKGKDFGFAIHTLNPYRNYAGGQE